MEEKKPRPPNVHRIVHEKSCGNCDHCGRLGGGAYCNKYNYFWIDENHLCDDWQNTKIENAKDGVFKTALGVRST